MAIVSRTALLGYAFVVATLIGLAAPPSAWPQCATAPAPTALAAFPGDLRFNNTVRAELWIADNAWWGAFSDAASGIYFYKLEGTTFVKGALIDANSAGLPDTLWNGTQLFILVYQSGSLARLYKYTYSGTTYSLAAGFPVDLPLAGLATVIALHHDSTGKLWAAYTSGPNIHVIWSTSADHTTWDTGGVVLAADISATATEAATLVHFGGSTIGVAWSNQALGEIGFRFHRDGDPETAWSPKEQVDCCQGVPGVANDHLSLRAAPDGRLFLTAKDRIGSGRVHLYIRDAAGTWGPKTAVDPDPTAEPTRPTLALDVENQHAYVFYTNSADNLVYFARTSLLSPAFEGRCVFGQGRNVTSTKQSVNGTTDLVAAASASGQIFAGRQDLVSQDTTPPTVTFSSPASGATVGGTQTVTATAADDVGVAGVEFFVDGAPLGADSTAPYEVAWDTTTATNGSHTLTARARDAAGNISTSAPVTVTVANGPPPDTTVPTVAISSPASGATVSGTVPVTATASDNVGVTGVEFFGDGVSLGTDSTSPYEVAWDTTTASNGSHTLTARARDAAGNTTTSAAVTVTAANTAAKTGCSQAVALTAFAGKTEFNNTVRAELWIADNAWWGAFSDASSGIYFYKLEGTTFVKSALIDRNFRAGRPDTLWNGRELFVLVYQSGSLARLYKYTYSATGMYRLVTGFPVDLPLAGLATVVALHQDSTGKLWAAYTSGSNVHVIWSSSIDHRTWNTGGVLLASDVADFTTEGATLVHFGGNRIGVVWSNQALGEIGFRFHRDGDPETAWSPKEQVDCCQGAPGVANDHLSLRAAPDGRLFLAAKDNIGSDQVHFYVRGAAGTWGQKTIVDPDPSSEPDRPTLVLDVNQHAYVVYRSSGHNRVYVARTSLQSPAFERCLFLSQGRNVTSTKQSVNGTTDLIAAASGSGQIFAGRQDLVSQDTTPPTVTISSPASGATVSGTRSVAATAADNVGVTGVEFFVDGAPLGTDSTAPYEVAWDTTAASNGSHTLTARARDAAGNTSTSAPVTVTVSNGPPPDTTAPTVAISSPASGATVSGTVPVKATASDNVGVTGVEFFVDGAPLGTDSTSPYEVAWDTTTASNGSHTLTARARDAAGNTSTSTPVTVTVSNGAPPDTTPPTVAISSPASGTTVSGTVPVTATASDNVGVTGVEFFVDGAPLGTDSTAPYEVAWNTTAASNGSHTLTAVARDSAGNRTTSAPVTVTVSNTSPPSSCATLPVPAAQTPFPGGMMFNNTIRAQMWIVDNTWWGAFSDTATGIYFQKRSSSSYTKGDFIDGNTVAGKPDTVWNGQELFILVYQSGSLARLYKYTYAPVSQTYALVHGFPVDLPLAGLAMNIALHQDSTGKLWAVYPSGTNIHVIWSTSPDHTVWNTTGLVLESGVTDITPEAATIAPFGLDKIGVVWSNQALGEIGFRFHRDGDPETSWSPKELVDCCQGVPGVADDHLALRAAPDGRLFLVAKDDLGFAGRLHLYVRDVGGTWGQKTLVEPDPAGQPTRPTLVLDVHNGRAYVIYHNSTDKRMYFVRTSLATPVFEGPCVFMSQGNDVTSTKQPLDATTGLIAAAHSRSTGQIVSGFIDLASASASASFLRTAAMAATAIPGMRADDPPSAASVVIGDGRLVSHPGPTCGGRPDVPVDLQQAGVQHAGRVEPPAPAASMMRCQAAPVDPALSKPVPPRPEPTRVSETAPLGMVQTSAAFGPRSKRLRSE
jgi:hypothetical protein